ncbi:MAG: hypothetical protein ABIJ81_00640 [Patescibacteria group bacterium]
MSEISQKQLEANRENAKLGGVKTEEGKEISKYNALKHGILSKEVLLDNEDEGSLIELGKRIRAEIKPVGEVELILTDRIIANIWRLRRFLEVERKVMELKREEQLSDSFNLKYSSKEKIERMAGREMIVNEDTEILLRYETAIERSTYKALHELQRIQAARAGAKPPAPLAIDVDVSKD